MPDIDLIAGQVVPLIEAAVTAYGTAVLTRAEDAAASSTVSLGRRILARILHRTAQPAPLEAAVADLVEDGQDPERVAALRLQVRKILTQYPELASELSAIALPDRQTYAMGTRTVAIGGDNHAPVTTGDHSPVCDAG